LLLGIVQVVDVDKGEAKIALAASDLIVQIARCQAMPASDDVVGLHHARPVVLVIQESEVAFLRSWWCAIERYVSAFRAHDYLIAPDIAA
jgi:hypothetical protein